MITIHTTSDKVLAVTDDYNVAKIIAEALAAARHETVWVEQASVGYARRFSPPTYEL